MLAAAQFFLLLEHLHGTLYTFEFSRMGEQQQLKFLVALFGVRGIMLHRSRCGTETDISEYYVLMASHRTNSCKIIYDLATHQLTVYVSVRMFTSTGTLERGAVATPAMERDMGPQGFSLLNYQWVPQDELDCAYWAAVRKKYGARPWFAEYEYE